jgi:hypothetical protein
MSTPIRIDVLGLGYVVVEGKADPNTGRYRHGAMGNPGYWVSSDCLPPNCLIESTRKSFLQVMHW